MGAVGWGINNGTRESGIELTELNSKVAALETAQAYLGKSQDQIVSQLSKHTTLLSAIHADLGRVGRVDAKSASAILGILLLLFALASAPLQFQIVWLRSELESHKQKLAHPGVISDIAALKTQADYTNKQNGPNP